MRAYTRSNGSLGSSSHTKEDIKNVKRLFAQWDANKDGVVSIQEMRSVLRQLDPTFSDFDLARMFDAADTNRNGVLEIDEFMRWIFAQNEQCAQSEQCVQKRPSQRKNVESAVETDKPSTVAGHQADLLPDWLLPTFHELSTEHGEIPYNKISLALELLGFEPVNNALLDTAMQKATGNSKPSTLDKRTFGLAVIAYSKAQEEKVDRLFESWDLNNDGKIDRAGFMRLIRQEFDFTIFPDVIEEILQDIGADSSGWIDQKQFAQVLQELTYRQGFTKSEISDLRSVFQRCADKDGRVSVTGPKSVQSCLGWLGYSAKVSDLIELVRGFTRDDHGSISHVDFPLIMRRYREKELKKVGKLFGAHDHNHTGTISRSELDGFVSKLCFLDPQVLNEFIEEAKLSNVGNFLFEDVWHLWSAIRRNGCFTRVEQANHKAAFERYAIPLKKLVKKYKKSFSLQSLESLESLMQSECHDETKKYIMVSRLGRALRWLGITLDTQKLLSFADQADITDNNSLDFEEFTKVLELIRTDTIAELQRVFSLNQEGDTPRRIDPATPQFGGLLRRIGCLPSSATLALVLKSLGNVKSLSILECFQFISSIREHVANTCRNNAGFSNREVTKWRQAFNKFGPAAAAAGTTAGVATATATILAAKTAHDTISQDKFIRLMPHVFDDIDENERNQIVEESLAGGDVDQSASIDFAEFLILMRSHVDRVEEVRLKQEREKRKEAERSNMNDLREIFCTADEDSSGHLSIEEVKRLIARAIGKAIDQPDVQAQLSMLLIQSDADCSGMLNFEEFSTLILCLEESNLAGINS